MVKTGEWGRGHQRWVNALLRLSRTFSFIDGQAVRPPKAMGVEFSTVELKRKQIPKIPTKHLA